MKLPLARHLAFFKLPPMNLSCCLVFCIFPKYTFYGMQYHDLTPLSCILQDEPCHLKRHLMAPIITRAVENALYFLPGVGFYQKYTH